MTTDTTTIQQEQEEAVDVDPALSECQAKCEEWKLQYLRALADYQNLEKRARNEKEEIRKFAGELFLMRLLPVIDTFERAQVHLKDAGLTLAFKQLTTTLEELGVEKIAVVGKTFDPHEMECIEVVEGKDQKVIEEVLSGYRLHGKVLRVAQVKVGGKTSTK